MKKWVALMLMAALTAGIAMPTLAQEWAAPDEGFVTQGELAQRLVERLGLWWAMGARPRPTNVECFGVLMAAGITPSEEGWQEDEPVTIAVLARVLVQALGGNALVSADRRADPEAWMNALRSLLEDAGIIETVEGSISVLVPDEGIHNIIEWFNVTSDELTRQHVETSIILGTVRDLPAPTPAPRRPVTPVDTENQDTVL